MEVSKLKLDVVEWAEKYVTSSRFTDLNRACVHDRMFRMARSGDEVPSEMVQYVYDRQMNHFAANANSLDELQVLKQRFDTVVWPVVSRLLQSNSGAVQLMLEFGVNSDYVAQFLYDVQKAPCIAVLLGHGIGHTVTGELEPIPASDPIFAFFQDASLDLFRFRAKEAGEEMRQAKDILSLGSGADPSLYARGYPLGKLGQRIVLYDQDPQAKWALEQIVEKPLESLDLDYRTSNLTTALQDESQFGQYDLVCLLGIAAYFADRSKFLFDGIYNLLKPGGRVIFDVQSMHPVLMFNVGVMGWSTDLHIEKDIATAIEVSQKYCDESGLQTLWTKTPLVTSPSEIPAGVVTLAQKP